MIANPIVEVHNHGTDTDKATQTQTQSVCYGCDRQLNGATTSTRRGDVQQHVQSTLATAVPYKSGRRQSVPQPLEHGPAHPAVH